MIAAAPQIERQLPFILRLRAQGLPVVLLLNMADEARRLGIRIDAPALREALGVPVVLMTAKRGDGHAQALAALAQGVADSAGAARVAELRARRTKRPTEREVARLMALAADVPARLPADAHRSPRPRAAASAASGCRCSSC